MPPIRIETPTGPIFIDPVTGDIVADPSGQTSIGTARTPQYQYSQGNPTPGFGSDAAGATAPSTTATPGIPNADFDPTTDRVTGLTKLPGGTQVTYVRNGATRTAFIADAAGGSGGVGASTAYAQQQENQRAAASLAEQQRQYNESFGMDKAKFNIQQQYKEAEDARQRALTQGNTLLGLGSRPDTLIKYLYALQGQQTPQGLQNTAAALPGYQGVVAPQTYGAPAAAPVAAPIAAPAAPVAAPSAATQTAQQQLVAAGRTPRFTTPEGVQIFGDGGQVNEPVIGRGLFSGQTIFIGEAGPETIVPEGDTVAEVKKRSKAKSGDIHDSPLPGVSAPQSAPGFGVSDVFDRPLSLFADGGVIGANPNVYQGLSGFGTNGKLRLAPNDPDAANLMAKYPGLYEITSAQNTLPTPGLSFGQGGAFQSYSAPAAAPTTGTFGGSSPIGGGFAPQSLFNPGAPSILNNLGGQFPQVGNLTGGGASLIPSVQKLGLATPTERSFYSGYLQDQAGVVPEDVFDLARRLNPGAKAGAIRGTRYAA